MTLRILLALCLGACVLVGCSSSGDPGGHDAKPPEGPPKLHVPKKAQQGQNP